MMTEITWHFSPKKTRSSLWYTIGGGSVFGIAIWGLILGQYGLSIVIVLLAGVYILIENNTQNDILVSIDALGITIDRTLYEYQKIRNFGIIYENNTPSLLRLHLSHKGINEIDVPFSPEISVPYLRNYLCEYIPEDEDIHHTFLEKILKMIEL